MFILAIGGETKNLSLIDCTIVAKGAIIPRELNAEAGDKYKIVKIGDAFVMTPIRTDLFAHEADWKGFRDSISAEDHEWDEVAD